MGHDFCYQNFTVLAAQQARMFAEIISNPYKRRPALLHLQYRSRSRKSVGGALDVQHLATWPIGLMSER